MNTETQNNMNREQLDLRKVLAEIDNLRAATLKMQSETQKVAAETLKTQIEAQTFKIRHLAAAFGGAVVLLAALKSLSLLPFFN